MLACLPGLFDLEHGSPQTHPLFENPARLSHSVEGEAEKREEKGRREKKGSVFKSSQDLARFYLLLYFKIGFCYVAQAGLDLSILLPWPSESCDDLNHAYLVDLQVHSHSPQDLCTCKGTVFLSHSLASCIDDSSFNSEASL